MYFISPEKNHSFKDEVYTDYPTKLSGYHTDIPWKF
jgi:hypothetical protein